MSSSRLRSLSEEQLQDLINRADKTLDELEGLIAEEQKLTHEKNQHVFLCEARQCLTGFRLSAANVQARKRILGR